MSLIKFAILLLIWFISSVHADNVCYGSPVEDSFDGMQGIVETIPLQDTPRTLVKFVVILNKAEDNELIRDVFSCHSYEKQGPSSIGTLCACQYALRKDKILPCNPSRYMLVHMDNNRLIIWRMLTGNDYHSIPINIQDIVICRRYFSIF